MTDDYERPRDYLIGKANDADLLFTAAMERLLAIAQDPTIGDDDPRALHAIAEAEAAMKARHDAAFATLAEILMVEIEEDQA